MYDGNDWQLLIIAVSKKRKQNGIQKKFSSLEKQKRNKPEEMEDKGDALVGDVSWIRGVVSEGGHVTEIRHGSTVNNSEDSVRNFLLKPL